MEFPHEGLDFLISVINGFLGMVRQDLDLRYLNRDRGFNPFVPLVLFFSTGYVAYLFRCVCQMKSLVKSCEIVWLLPLMIQYSFMLVNGHLQYQTSLQFIQWMKQVFHEEHPIKFVQKNVSEMNRKCIQAGNIVIE